MIFAGSVDFFLMGILLANVFLLKKGCEKKLHALQV